MELLEKEWEINFPYGNTQKKLKDISNGDFWWLSEKDKVKLLQELNEEYKSLKHTYAACEEEYYRLKVLKCKDCDSDARLMLASIGF